MQIKIPGTLGDFGPGHNSLGIALAKYFTVELLGPAERWQIESDSDKYYESDEHNYVVAVALKLVADLPAQHLKIHSELDASLGEEQAALLAGIELARLLGAANLDAYTMLTLAARTFNDASRVTAAILGGVTSSFFHADEVYASGLVLPAYQVLLYRTTKFEPNKCEKSFSATQLAQYGAAGNMLITAWQNQQKELAGKLLEIDFLLDELPAELVRLRQLTSALDIYGTFLVDDLIVTLVPEELSADLLAALAYVDDLTGEFELLELAKEGIIN